MSPSPTARSRATATATEHSTPPETAPSFSSSLDPSAYNEEGNLELRDPSSKQPISFKVLYDDAYLAFKFVARGAVYPTRWAPADRSFCESGRLAPVRQALADEGFVLEWSGVGAPALSDERPAGILARMVHIVDCYLAAHPHERTIKLCCTELPGPAGQAIRVSDEMTKEQLKYLLEYTYVAVVNRLLALCTRAAGWYAFMGPRRGETWGCDGRREAPVPLHSPLTLSMKMKSDVEQYKRRPWVNQDEKQNQDADAPTLDFALRWEGERPGENLAVGEVAQWLRDCDACSWTAPAAFPLGVQSMQAGQRDHATATTTHAAAAAGDAQEQEPPPPKRARSEAHVAARDGYSLDTWEQKLLLHVASQLYLHNTTCGALIGDYGRMLIMYELCPLDDDDGDDDDGDDDDNEAKDDSGDSDDGATDMRALTATVDGKRFALRFAPKAICSFLPSCGGPRFAHNQNPNALAELLNRLYSPGSTRLAFTGTPGIIGALLHWALYSFDVAVRQGRRPVPVPGREEPPAHPSPSSSGEGRGVSAPVNGDGSSDEEPSCLQDV